MEIKEGRLNIFWENTIIHVCTNKFNIQKWENDLFLVTFYHLQRQQSVQMLQWQIQRDFSGIPLCQIELCVDRSVSEYDKSSRMAIQCSSLVLWSWLRDGSTSFCCVEGSK